MLSLLLQSKESKAPLCPTSSSEHPLRWCPGYQPGKEEPPLRKQGFEPPSPMATRDVGQVSAWASLNATRFHFISAINPPKLTCGVVQPESLLQPMLKPHKPSVCTDSLPRKRSSGCPEGRGKGRQAKVLFAPLSPLFPTPPTCR